MSAANPPPLAHAVRITWKRNGAYALRLVDDLAPELWTTQPIAGRTLNHPAWIFAHLNVYTPICIALLRAQPFDDPIDHPFGQKSEVLADPAAYPSGHDLILAYRKLHDQADHALEHAASGTLAAPNPLERWRTLHPFVGDMIVTLMVKHESAHLGQLSAWRRAMGLPRVAM